MNVDPEIYSQVVFVCNNSANAAFMAQINQITASLAVNPHTVYAVASLLTDTTQSTAVRLTGCLWLKNLLRSYVEKGIIMSDELSYVRTIVSATITDVSVEVEVRKVCMQIYSSIVSVIGVVAWSEPLVALLQPFTLQLILDPSTVDQYAINLMMSLIFVEDQFGTMEPSDEEGPQAPLQIVDHAFQQFSSQYLLPPILDFYHRMQENVAVPGVTLLVENILKILNVYNTHEVFTVHSFGYEFFDRVFQSVCFGLGTNSAEVRRIAFENLRQICTYSPQSIHSLHAQIFETVLQTLETDWPQSGAALKLSVTDYLNSAINMTQFVDLLSMDQLPRLIRALCNQLPYDALDLADIDHQHLTTDNSQSVPETNINPGFNEKVSTWGASWTVRKSSAYCIDLLATNIGAPIVEPLIAVCNEVLSTISAETPQITHHWEALDAAILALGAGVTDMQPGTVVIPTNIIEKVVIASYHPLPIVRAISLWCLQKLAPVVPVQDDGIIQAIVARVTDCMRDPSKYVEDSATSAMIEYVLYHGSATHNLNGNHILETLSWALVNYSVYNRPLLYDLVADICSYWPKSFIHHPYGSAVCDAILSHLSTSRYDDYGIYALADSVSVITRTFSDVMSTEHKVQIYRQMESMLIEFASDLKDEIEWDPQDQRMKWFEGLVDVVGRTIEPEYVSQQSLLMVSSLVELCHVVTHAQCQMLILIAVCVLVGDIFSRPELVNLFVSLFDVTSTFLYACCNTVGSSTVQSNKLLSNAVWASSCLLAPLGLQRPQETTQFIQIYIAIVDQSMRTSERVKFGAIAALSKMLSVAPDLTYERLFNVFELWVEIFKRHPSSNEKTQIAESVAVFLTNPPSHLAHVVSQFIEQNALIVRDLFSDYFQSMKGSAMPHTSHSHGSVGYMPTPPPYREPISDTLRAALDVMLPLLN